ncbi:MAG: GTPase, partial [Nitrospinota bacterium]
MKPKPIIIMGAAGRDFHNFNTCFRDNPAYRVVAFTAAQIPNIEHRSYPPELAGSLYPQGIPIVPEDELAERIASHGVKQVVFAYSDISHEDVMHHASLALASGADFLLLGPGETMLKSRRAVIAVCAVRTGTGKSQASRRVVEVLKELGKRPVVVRHPMPYGDLRAQRLQRFASLQDLERYRCTIEEQEEYEPHLAAGSVVYAGVDYEAILRKAEEEADVIVWDGGNNDFPFFRPDCLITLLDPHRAGHELSYHPGETNLLMADALIITKVGTARAEDIALVKKNIAAKNPRAVVIEADSSLTLDKPELVAGKRVLVVEDGPSVTHGGMPSGAGALAAERFGAG